MVDGIGKQLKDAIVAQAKEQGLTARALKEKGVHALATGEEGTALVVPDVQGVDRFEAHIVDAGGRTPTPIEKVETHDLGELGAWTVWQLPEVGADIDVGSPARFRGLEISTPGKGKKAALETFTHVGLGYLVSAVLSDEGDLKLRGTQPKDTVHLDAAEQAAIWQVLSAASGKSTPVDERVPRKLLDQLRAKLPQAQKAAAEALARAEAEYALAMSACTGLTGLLVASGAAPQGFKLPAVNPAELGEEKPEDGDVLTASTYDLFEVVGVSLPEDGEVTVQWASEAIDKIRAAGKPVPSDLRALLVQAEAAAESAEDLFADEFAGEPKAEAAAPTKRDQELEKLERMRAARLAKAVEGLEVDPAAIRSVSKLLSDALANGAKPGLIVFAGPPNSAADRLLDVCLTTLTSKRPILLTRQHLSPRTMAAVTGELNGAPSGTDSPINPAALNASRDTQLGPGAALASGSMAAIVLRGMEATGSTAAVEEQRQAALRELLVLLSSALKDGVIHTCFKTDRPVADKNEVSLRKTMLLGRWEGSADELRRAIAENPRAFGSLAPRIIETGELSPAAGVRYLEQRLGFDVEQGYARKGVTVELEPKLRELLEKVYQEVGAEAGFDRFYDGLHTALVAFCNTPPPFGERVQVALRSMSAGERQELAQGLAVENPFRLSSAA